MTALVRVFVPTYRRAHLLGRALRSLQAQTLPHWVAEVRNDAPDDEAPREIVRTIGDPRISYIRHESNLGGSAIFNLVYREQPEPFVGLLEDDNWWEPDFLATMVASLDAHPEVTIAWANQSIWEETSVGEWRDTQRLVRPPSHTRTPVLVHWPQPAQCSGALHANGSMLMRTRAGRSFSTPSMDIGGTEAFRERSFPHPLLYVPTPLAAFAVTRTTNRTRNPADWGTKQVLLAATFFKHVRAAPEFWRDLWARARLARPCTTDILLLATRQDPALRAQRRHATRNDWRHLAWRAIRRPRVFLALTRARQRAREQWDFLDGHTAERARETNATPTTAASVDALFR